MRIALNTANNTNNYIGHVFDDLGELFHAVKKETDLYEYMTINAFCKKTIDEYWETIPSNVLSFLNEKETKQAMLTRSAKIIKKLCDNEIFDFMDGDFYDDVINIIGSEDYKFLFEFYDLAKCDFTFPKYDVFTRLNGEGVFVSFKNWHSIKFRTNTAFMQYVASLNKNGFVLNQKMEIINLPKNVSDDTHKIIANAGDCEKVTAKNKVRYGSKYLVE